MNNISTSHYQHIINSALSGIPFDTIGFLMSCSKDFEHEIEYLSRISRPVDDHNYSIIYKLEPNMKFGASVAWVDSRTAQTTINFGTWFALQDLFYRMCSNGTFFSYDNDDGKNKLWDGCKCIWTNLNGIQPRSRFCDYRISSKWGDPEVKHIGQFFEAIPFSDPDRMKLAQMLTRTALLWIMLHEEGHFLDGHLAYLGDECGLVHSDVVFEEAAPCAAMLHNSEKLRRYFEFSADRTATRGVFDVLFMDHQLENLPSYCRDEPEKWLFRLLIVAIGSVFQIMQKMQNFENVIGFYPSARVRFSGITRYLSNKIDSVTRPPHCCKNPTVYDSLEIPGLFISGCDDLCAVAALINREGTLDMDQKEEAPVKSRLGIHGLFETEEMVGDFIEVFTLIHLHPNVRLDFIKKVHGEHRVSDILARYDYWFEDFENAEIAYRDFAYANLIKYRNYLFEADSKHIGSIDDRIKNILSRYKNIDRS